MKPADTDKTLLIDKGAPEKTLDFNKLFVILLSRWYILALALCIGLVIAYLQLRYTKPLYNAKLSLKFEDDKGGQVGDLFRYGRISGRIENMLKTESEVMKSRSMSMKTLQDMQMYTSAYIEGDIVSSMLYPNYYFDVKFIHLDSADIGKSFVLRFSDAFNYDLLINKNNTVGEPHSVNDTLNIGKSLIQIRVLNNRMIKAINKQPITVVINNLLYKAINFAANVDVEAEKNTNIVQISYTSDVPELASDYVNSLAKAYIQSSIDTKTQAAQQTIRYIDEQLIELSKKVSSSQGDLSQFKSTNKGISPSEIGKIEFDRLITYETQRNILLLRKKQLEALEKNILSAKNKTIELIIFDAEDAKALEGLFDLLNALILERISYSGKNQSASPIMLENEKKIHELKSALVRTLNSIRSNLDNKIQNSEKQIADLNNNLESLPSKEQTLFNLERNFKINEKIYGYLQERRLENMISMSSIISNVSIIDEALVNRTPIFPRPQNNYLMAVLISLGVGIGIIFLSRYIYDKVPDKETIESISRVPVIGVIKKIDSKNLDHDYSIEVMKNPKSIFSESIRGIRTNINFILKGESNKTICVTSSVSGEGKTFCTINLAASMTLLGYKAVIVGCDFRRPKIHFSFNNISNQIGLTSYLVKKNTLDEIIKRTEYENLFVVPAGPTPPNPAELLQTEEFNNFVSELRKRFDFIFFDTAPVGLVSDSFSLLTSSDINLFIIRAQYSKRDFALIPDRLRADNNVQNIYTLLNSFDSSSVAYSSIYRTEYGGYYGGGGYFYYGGYYGKGGYGYYNNSYTSGYYSEEEAKSSNKLSQRIRRIFNRFKINI